MATKEDTSAYTVLEKLIRYFEKKKGNVKLIIILKERKSLDFMNQNKRGGE